MIERLQKALPAQTKNNFGAFYASAMGGIVTDPALMAMPVDDAFVHKGYGISECVLLRQGHLYMLQQHMDRLREHCKSAGLELPFKEPALQRIIYDTAAASRKLNGMVRFWVTPGRTSYTPIDVSADSEPAFYALCSGDMHVLDRTVGWDALTAPAILAPTPYAYLPGNQHRLTSMAQRSAVSQGADVSIFVDEKGFVQHCAGLNLFIRNKRKVLVYPPHDFAPTSVTLDRLLELLPEERKRSPDDVLIDDVQQRPLHVSEVAEAEEAFVICSTYLVAPLKSLDGKRIGDGRPGITALAFHYMLDNDLTRVPSPRHTQVPYGYVTGMRSQLV